MTRAAAAPRSAASPRGQVDFGAFRQVLAFPGRYLNDHCLLRHDGCWHFFGIVGEVDSPPPKREVSFAHAVSPDLRNWEPLPDCLGYSGAWPEERGIIAPHVTAHDGRFYMLYSGIDAWTTQRICLAVSDDLSTWRRFAGNPVITPSLTWSRWPGFGLPAPQELGDPNLDAPEARLAMARQVHGTYGGCRDPHVMQLEDGTYAAYWVSRLQAQFGHNQVGVAASVSRDLTHWQEVGPVFWTEAWPFDLEPTLEVESPCVVRKDGSYWLFYKHGWWTHVVRADSPFDFRGQAPRRLGFAHAAEVFEWRGVWWITHCSGEPTDYRYRRTNRTRGLFLGRLDWPAGGWPALVAD